MIDVSLSLSVSERIETGDRSLLCSMMAAYGVVAPPFFRLVVLIASIFLFISARRTTMSETIPSLKLEICLIPVMF